MTTDEFSGHFSNYFKFKVCAFLTTDRKADLLDFGGYKSGFFDLSAVGYYTSSGQYLLIFRSKDQRPV